MSRGFVVSILFYIILISLVISNFKEYKPTLTKKSIDGGEYNISKYFFFSKIEKVEP